ncbi:MAG: baeRF10 domain-containing protein [Acidimicrobiales bacterium]
MNAKKRDRDPPPVARSAVVETERVDPEHPMRPLPPVTVSARSLEEAVHHLETVESTAAPIVSVCWPVPADPGQLKAARARLVDLVKLVRERAESDEVSHEARMSLRADADHVLELDQLAPKLQGRTLVFFRCNHLGFEEAVVAPGGLPARIVLDATPFIRPLLEVLDEAHRYAVVVVDREHGWLFEFYLGELEAQARTEGQAPRKPNYAAGDKEHGIHHKVQELAKRHYRETADALQQLVQDDGIELVVVGGHEDTVPAFIDRLPHDLQSKVVGTFVIDPHTMTPTTALDAAQEAVDAYERHEEEMLVDRALERVAIGGLGAVGLQWCLLAVDELAVQHLLVQADAITPGRACDRCGWLGLAGGECPIDGEPTRETPDVLDEMAARVLRSSGHIEHVHADTPLRDELVAALLRFPVPRPVVDEHDPMEPRP